MGKDTKIEWCHHTWNPWQGCHKVSIGCKNCYMFRDKKRFNQDPNLVILSKDKTFFQPAKWSGPARVFVCSWSDFFLEEADGWRPAAWNVIRENSQLGFLILTKRIERPFNDWSLMPKGWPFPNVYLGVSVENQEMADLRIPMLMQFPMHPQGIKFISVEPMLGPVDLFDLCAVGGPGDIDWVICGCESGRGARVTELAWIRNLRDQCVNANVKFFLKQMRTKQSFQTMPPLDGQVWDQTPDM